MAENPTHSPHGDPCGRCGHAALSHRPTHAYEGDPKTLCDLCWLPMACHEKRKKREKKSTSRSKEYVYLGLDGEGQGRDDHRYVLLAASDETGSRTFTLERPDGRIRTREALEFLLSLPHERVKVFSFAFNYDISKMLEDIDDENLYYLVRPDLRQRYGKDEAKKGPWPIKWFSYSLNMQGTKLTIRRGKRRIVIWDIFKFYGIKFVTACKDWKVGLELLAKMSEMKDKRSEFDKESPQDVKEYCLGECRCIAELARKLTDAHTKVGLKLKSYYGAGSSGGAMLDLMKVRDYQSPVPFEMREAVASAFFGGRFENSVIGEIREPLWNYDISSAYPYQCFFLPCLIHGRWVHTTNEADIISEIYQSALVSYSLGKYDGHPSWGPFPFRTDDGSICFPIESGGGWVWRDEYLAGKAAFPHVQFKEAWVYECACDCKPFAKLPEYYLFRIAIGKEGPGLVIKLAINSCYGKLAQSVGSARYNNWIWAGLITSGCRAQILRILGLHREPRNLLMVATDGIYTRERFIVGAADRNIPYRGGERSIAAPSDTGTFSCGKPLGGWEEKYAAKGVFVARPGIYFPLDPSPEEIKEIRGRGVGKGVVLENHKEIVRAWKLDGLTAIARVANVSRFIGCKTGITRAIAPWVGHPPTGPLWCDRCKLPSRAHWKYNRSERYGQWITRRVELGFNPEPKRSGVNEDGLTLIVKRFARTQRSVPYNRAMRSAEALELMAAAQEMLEQPDPDLTDYEYGE